VSASDRANALKASVTTISRNLMEYGETEGVVMVRARLKDPVNGFTGATRDVIAKAVNLLDGLWSSYLLLAGILEQASDLIARSGVFRNNDSAIQELLEGKSIELPLGHIPINARSLLASATRTERTSPDELLQAMEQQFGEAQDAINRITTLIAQSAPRLMAINQQFETLANWAKALGATSVLARDLGSVVAGLNTDPLGCAAELDRMEGTIDKQRAVLQSIEDERTSVSESLEQARKVVAELKDLAGRSSAAIEEARAKILHPEGLMQPVSDESIASLSAWLTTLECNVGAGRSSAAKVGLERWHAQSESLVTAQRQAYARNRAALDERADLKGRFRALQAKAGALAARNIPTDPVVQSLGLESETALNTVPIDLNRARRAVDSYESALSALGTQGNAHR